MFPAVAVGDPVGVEAVGPGDDGSGGEGGVLECGVLLDSSVSGGEVGGDEESEPWAGLAFVDKLVASGEGRAFCGELGEVKAGAGVTGDLDLVSEGDGGSGFDGEPPFWLGEGGGVEDVLVAGAGEGLRGKGLRGWARVGWGRVGWGGGRES